MNKLFSAYNETVKSAFKLAHSFSLFFSNNIYLRPDLCFIPFFNKARAIFKFYFKVCSSWFSKFSLNTTSLYQRPEPVVKSRVFSSNFYSYKKAGGKKTFPTRVVAAIKKGYNTPNLPPHILELQNRLYIRFLRFVGGISLMYFLCTKLDGAHMYLKFIIGFNLIVFMLYNGYITYHRIRHM